MRELASGGVSFARRFVHRATLLLIAAACLGSSGCLQPTHTARRWLDPLGLMPKKELGDQPDFQQQVKKDDFPTAGQIGLRPIKPE